MDTLWKAPYSLLGRVERVPNSVFSGFALQNALTDMSWTRKYAVPTAIYHLLRRLENESHVPPPLPKYEPYSGQ